jgi:GDP-L-fucose synthase
MATILITGCGGLMGHTMSNLLNDKNTCKGLQLRKTYRQEYDLRKEDSVRAMYELIRPDYVVNCAAVVGGVKFNNECPEVLYRDNLLINTHMIHYAHQYGVKHLISFSSACAFQDGVFPFKEENLQDGKPYVGNLAYGYAKRMVDVQTQVYNKVYGRKDLTLIPVNLYGPHDNFNLENGHFISSLIHKIYLAKQENKPVVLWGDGSPLRELLFAEDLAKVIIELIDKEVPYDKFLVTSGQEVSICEVASLIADLMGYDKANIVWDTSKPKGQYRKPADPSRLKEVLPDFKFTDYRDGLRKTIEWFLKEKSSPWCFVRD